MRAFDTRNDLGSITLRGVSARFIERIHFREVVVDRSVVQASKSHTRNLVKHRRSGASEVKNENGRTNFVHSSAETTQNIGRMIAVVRFADYFMVKRYERIGGKNNFLRVDARDREPFAHSVKRSDLSQRKVDIASFIDLRRSRIELEARDGEKFPASRRL